MALGMSAAALLLCFICGRRPSLISIAGSLVVILSALAVVVYGANVSSTYPWQALQTSVLELEQSEAARSYADVAHVRTGFGLAIAAAVFSAMGSALMIFKSMMRRPEEEMAVVQAAPLTIHQPSTGVLAVDAFLGNRDTPEGLADPTDAGREGGWGPHPPLPSAPTSPQAHAGELPLGNLPLAYGIVSSSPAPAALFAGAAAGAAAGEPVQAVAVAAGKTLD